MATTLNKITYINDGRVDLSKLIENVEIVRDATDEETRLRLSLADDVGQHHPHTVSYAIDERGDCTVLGKSPRAVMKLKQCFITAGCDGVAVQIEVLKNGNAQLCEPISLKASENRGKVAIGDVIGYHEITQFDEIVVRSDSERRVVVTLNFERSE